MRSTVSFDPDIDAEIGGTGIERAQSVVTFSPNGAVREHPGEKET